MTRREFIENVTTWGELVEFCYDEGLEECIEDIWSEDSYDECINEFLRDYVRSHSWVDVLDYLNDLPSGYDYYQRGDYDETWTGLNYYDCCDEWYKNNVMERMNNDDAWDEEEEEEEEAEESAIIDNEDPFDNIPVEQEDILVDDLFAACSDAVLQIKQREIEQQKTDDELEERLFDELCRTSGVA